jgi:hypothetical protein
MSEETKEQVILVAYVLTNAPFIYAGELYYDEEDAERKRIILKKPMLHVANPKEKTQMWTTPPAVGRDSSLCIDTTTNPGLLVIEPEQEFVESYKRAHLQAFTKIHLA